MNATRQGDGKVASVDRGAIDGAGRLCLSKEKGTPDQNRGMTLAGACRGQMSVRVDARGHPCAVREEEEDEREIARRNRSTDEVGTTGSRSEAEKEKGVANGQREDQLSQGNKTKIGR